MRQDSWRSLRAILSTIPEIRHMALLGGEFDVILLVRTADNAALRDLVPDRLQAIDGVLFSRTFLVFDDLDGPPFPA